jgi:hypothetical protein
VTDGITEARKGKSSDDRKENDIREEENGSITIDTLY